MVIEDLDLHRLEQNDSLTMEHANAAPAGATARTGSAKLYNSTEIIESYLFKSCDSFNYFPHLLSTPIAWYREK